MALRKKNTPTVIVLEKANMSEEAWEEMEAAIRSIAEKHLGIARRTPDSKAATINHLKEVARRRSTRD